MQSPVKINNNNITRCSHQKHLGVTFESNFNFNTPIDLQIKKCKKMIGLIRQISVNLPDNALLSIYKSFTRPHLDYGYILYNNQAMIILQNGTKWKKFNIELVYQ